MLGWSVGFKDEETAAMADWDTTPLFDGSCCLVDVEELVITAGSNEILPIYVASIEAKAAERTQRTMAVCCTGHCLLRYGVTNILLRFGLHVVFEQLLAEVLITERACCTF